MGDHYLTAWLTLEHPFILSSEVSLKALLTPTDREDSAPIHSKTTIVSVFFHNSFSFFPRFRILSFESDVPPIIYP